MTESFSVGDRLAPRTNLDMDEATAWFLSYVRGRRIMMAGGGAALAAVAIIVIVIHYGSSNLNTWMAGVALGGVLVVVGSLNGRRVLREIIPSCRDRAARWNCGRGVRESAGSAVINRVLSTLDDVGGRNRTPKIEFKAIWYTPGIAESPSGEARVYGGEGVGQAVLAIGNQARSWGR